MTNNQSSPNKHQNPYVSDEERSQFVEAMRGIKPIDKDTKEKNQHRHEKNHAGSTQTIALPLLDHIERIAPEATFSFHTTNDNRILSRLRSGKIPVQTSLDLHGYRLQEAAEELQRALHKWQKEGHTVARIVHGKGNAQRFSVIKSHMPIWLERQPSILAYSSCQPRDGGAGAVIVLLKKSHS